jgi:hypothetical protein
MSTINLATLQSNTALPPTIQNSSGTQIGTFCRAWVNFNGTGTVAIRASFNVSSITDNGTGSYTVNFTTAMSDANYSWSGAVTNFTGGFISSVNLAPAGTLSTSNFTAQVLQWTSGGTLFDPTYCLINVFR